MPFRVACLPVGRTKSKINLSEALFCFKDLDKLEPIFTTATAASKNHARVKSGQNRLKKLSNFLDKI